MSKDVKLYALSTCVHCKNTKKYLDDCNVDYHCVFVDTLEGEERKQAVEEVKKYNTACSFPTIVITDEKGEERVIVGFRKDKLQEVLGI